MTNTTLKTHMENIQDAMNAPWADDPAHSILLTESEMESIMEVLDEAVEINEADRTNEELDKLSELRTGLYQALELIREGYMHDPLA